MGKYEKLARELLKKIEYAPSLEDAKRLLSEFPILASRANRSKKTKEDVSIIYALKETAEDCMKKYL